MLTLLGKWLGRSGLRRAQRKAARHDARTALVADLRVRALEERRVFHAGALGTTTVQPAPSSPPPPTTTVTLDSSQNLVIDASAGGQNDQLSIRFDAERSRYEIYDPTRILTTDIEGASGSGTHRVFVSLAGISGSKLVVETGGGNDSLALDLAGGLGGKALVFDGGSGEDSLSLMGGSHELVGYLFTADGQTQIQVTGAAGTQLALSGVEPIFDSLAAQQRSFTSSGIAGLTLSDDGQAGDGQSQVTTSLGTSVVFASPLHSLSLSAVGEGVTLRAEGADLGQGVDLHLSARGGHVDLAGTIDLRGGDLMAGGDSVEVAGTIRSHDATINIRATSSLIATASSAIDNAEGRVVLDAGTSGTLEFSGTIDVSGDATQARGGTVRLLGHTVRLLDQARIDASGTAGGGTVLVGGDYQGRNPDVHHAWTTYVGEDVVIRANATSLGDGGKIIVWADDAAIVAGSGNLQARGGRLGGDGGLIETSGKRFLYVGGAADARAYAGSAGTWLLDPRDIEIIAGTAGTIPGSGNFSAASNTTQLGADTIATALKTTNVTITTGNDGTQDGNITFLTDVVISADLTAGVTRTLTLHAANDIVFQSGSGIDTVSGVLNISLNANSSPMGNDDGDTSAGDVIFGGGTIDTNGGNFLSRGVRFSNTGTITTGAAATTGLIDILHTGLVTIGGALNAALDASVRTGVANIRIESNITAGDEAIVLTSDGNIVFDAGTIVADEAVIRAVGGTLTAIDGTVAVDISGGTGTGVRLELRGDEGIGSVTQGFTVNGGTGTVTATTQAANIFLAASGDLRLGAVITSGASAQTVNIRASALDGQDIVVAAASTTNDNWTLTATGDVSFEAAINAATASVTAGGNITSPTATAKLITAGGTIGLSAGGTIGTSVAAPFAVSAGTGDVTLTSGGNIWLLSTVDLDLGVVTTGTGAQTIDIRTTIGQGIEIVASSTTDDDWTLVASSEIDFVGNVTLTARSANLTASAGGVLGGTATSDLVTTSSATIDGNSIGTADDSLVLQPGAGTLSLSADNGGIFVEIAALGTAFSTSQLTLVSNTTLLGSTVEIVVLDAALEIASGTAFTNLANDAVTLGAAGTSNDIRFTGAATFDVGSLTLKASGAISSGAGAFDLATNAGQAISLVGDSIGTSASPLVLSPGGTLSVQSAGDIYLRQASGDLSTSIFTLLTSTATGAQISIGTLAGSVLVNNVTGFDIDDDNLTVEAAGAGSNISFQTTLEAATITLNAAEQILSRIGSSAVDVRALTGGITLVAGGGIGESGNALVVQSPGVVTVTTTTSVTPGATGNIYLSSTGTLNLGIVSTNGGVQTVEIGTTGTGADLNLTVSNTSNDQWRLDAARDLVVGSLVTTEAASFTLLRAGRNIVSGVDGDGTEDNVDFRTTDAASTIALQGGAIGSSGNDLTLQHAGNLTLHSAGDIWLKFASGNLDLSRLTSVTMTTPGSTLGLATAAGSIVVSGGGVLAGLSNQALVLDARGGGDIVFAAADSQLQFAEVTLRAMSGSIHNLAAPGTGGVNIVTSGGDITLESAGPIGAPLQWIYVSAGSGTVTATTTSAVGNIFLRSATGLALGNINAQDSGTQLIQIVSDAGMQFTQDHVTEDIWDLIATGDIAFTTGTLTASAVYLTTSGNITASSDAVTHITADYIELNAAAIGALGARLAIDPASTPGSVVVNAASGDVYLLVTSSGGFQTSQLAGGLFLAAGRRFDLTIAQGNLTIDGGLALAGVDVALDSQSGNVAFTGGLVQGRAVTVSAAGGIVSSTALLDIQAAGNITLTGQTGIGANGNALVIDNDGLGLVELTTSAAGGHIFVQSPDVLRLGQVTTGAAAQTVNVQSTSELRFEASSNTNDAWTVAAQGDIRFVGAANLTAATASLTTPGALVSGTAAVDVSTTGSLTLIANAGIGAGSAAFSVQTGASSHVDATTVGGDIFLVSPGRLRIGQIQTGGGGTQTVNLESTDAASGLELLAASATNDIWQIRSAGYLRFGTSGTVSAASFAADVDGAIESGGAALDINTAASNGAIDLTAGDNIGASGNPLAVRAGNGIVSAATTDGDIYIASAGSLFTGGVTAGGGAHVISLSTTGAGGLLRVAQDSLGDDQWRLNASDDVRLILTGVGLVELGQLQTLVAGGNDVLIQAAGPIRVSEIQSGVATSDDNVTIESTSGSISFSNTRALAATNLTLVAAGSVLDPGTDSIRKLDVSNRLTIDAGLTIGALNAPLVFAAHELQTSSGISQHLAASAPTRIVLATAGGQIELAEGKFHLLPPTLATATVFANQLAVTSDAILAGTGVVQGNLYVGNNGSTDPGFDASVAGQITIRGDATFDLGSDLVFDINSPYLLAGRDYDHFLVTGTLILNSPVLNLAGAEDLRVTINPITLFDLSSHAIGQFQVPGGSLGFKGSSIEASVNNFRGTLLFDGGADQNDIVISEFSFLPPNLTTNFRPPQITLPVFTRPEAPLPDREPPPAVAPPVEPALVETQREIVTTRLLKICVLIPIDDEGHFIEEKVLELPEEWLKDLTGIFQRLPDDRYRIYLVMPGNEERRVMDVFVRDGRPFDPSESQPQFVPPAIRSEDLPAASPAVPNDAPPANRAAPVDGRGAAIRAFEAEAADSAAVQRPASAASRMFVGAGLAAAALVAGRRPRDGWTRQIEACAAELSERKPLGLRWWRLRRERPTSKA